ncbi:MAG: hypothetical protein GY928_18655 [Colwellia sp.]|nr:hypothetical protein [Colwellia sp.]
MITREEYIKALDVVEEYHFQIREDAKKRPTLWEFALKHEDKMSTRVFNCIKAYTHIWNHSGYELDTKNILYEDIKINELRKFRNMGQVSITEFMELRGY